MPLPSAAEINPFDDLDGRVARDHFLGKTVEDAEAMFRESSLYYQSDLMWMGSAAFRYYVQAAMGYIRSEAATNDSDFIAALADTLEHRIQHEREELAPIAKRLERVCEYIVAQWPKFVRDSQPYGDVRARYLRLQRAFSTLSSE